MTDDPPAPRDDTTGERCAWAIAFGTLATRCTLPPHQTDRHIGRGLAEFSYQSVEWFAGDRREFTTERDDPHAWEVAT